MSDDDSRSHEELKRLVRNAIREEVHLLRPVNFTINVVCNVNSPTFIKITDSQGVQLNYDSIVTVDRINIKIETLRQTRHQDIADALKGLGKAIVALEKNASEHEKEMLLGQVSYLSEQATLVEDKRNPGVIDATLTKLATAAGALGGLASAWQTWGPAISKFFGV